MKKVIILLCMTMIFVSCSFSKEDFSQPTKESAPTVSKNEGKLDSTLGLDSFKESIKELPRDELSSVEKTRKIAIENIGEDKKENSKIAKEYYLHLETIAEELNKQEIYSSEHLETKKTADEVAKDGLIISSGEGMYWISVSELDSLRIFTDSLSDDLLDYISMLEKDSGLVAVEETIESINWMKNMDYISGWDVFLREHGDSIMFERASKHLQQNLLLSLLIAGEQLYNIEPPFEGYKYFIKTYPTLNSKELIERFYKAYEQNSFKKLETDTLYELFYTYFPKINE